MKFCEQREIEVSWVGPGKPNLPLELRGKPGGSARVTTGPKTQILQKRKCKETLN